MDIKSINQFSTTNTLVHPDSANSPATQLLGPVGTEDMHEGKVSHSLLGALSRVAPALAARVCYASLAKSRFTEELPWQKELRERARISFTPHVKFYGGVMKMYKWGSGPTVLMVNGWGERATSMARLIQGLVTAGFRVVAFDRPPYVEGKEADSDLIEFITAVHVAAQAAGNLHAIIGHSFGAAMAMASVRDWGDFASRHVLISPMDHRDWIDNEFGRHRELKLHVALRMREVVDKRYDRLVDWDMLTMPELMATNRRPTLLIRDEHAANLPIRFVANTTKAKTDMDYFLTNGLTRDQQPNDPAVITRVIGFLRTPDALSARLRNERLC
jgi:alpha-beta hydrolase superfamily lysophospholipase